MGKTFPPSIGPQKTDGISLWQLLLGLLFAALLTYLGIFSFAKWQANQASPQTVKDRIELEFTIQNHLFEAIRIFSSLAFVVTAYYAWRNLKISEQNRILAEDKQVAERFSKSVEMLGSSDKFEMQLGGIYSLARIAKDSPTDYWTVIEVLTAFIRSHSPLLELKEGEEQPSVTSSVQAALTTLSNLISLRSQEQEKLDIVLARINLRGAKLYEGNLSKVFLSESNMEEVDLNGANLSGARLFKTILDDANLVNANFTKADLAEASLIEADVYKADFREVIGLNDKQVKKAKSWEDAKYSPPFRKLLDRPSE